MRPMWDSTVHRLYSCLATEASLPQAGGLTSGAQCSVLPLTSWGPEQIQPPRTSMSSSTLSTLFFL